MIKDVLSDLSLCWCSSSSKVIKVTVKPFVYFPVDGVVVVTDFTWGLLVSAGFCLRGCAILISSAHIDAVVANKTSETSIHISGQHTANDVTKMRHVVNIWQGTSDQDVSLALLW